MASTARLPALVALLALVVACKSKSRPQPAPTASSSSAALVLTVKPTVDPQALNTLRALTLMCKVEPASGLSCEGDQRREYVNFLARAPGPERAALVGTFAVALADANPKLRLVAAGIAEQAFRSSLGSGLEHGAVKVDDSRALLEVLDQLPQAEAIQVTPLAVHAATLARERDGLYGLLDKHPELAPTAYRYLMTHGRLDAFPKIRELSHSKRRDLQLAAIESVRTMQDWSEAERKELCPWALDLYQNGKAELRVLTATLLVNCPGRPIDQLLSQSEAWYSDKSLSHTTMLSLRGLCAKATAAQCDRLRQLFATVAADQSLDAQIRAAAQEGLKAQGPDNTKSSGP